MRWLESANKFGYEDGQFYLVASSLVDVRVVTGAFISKGMNAGESQCKEMHGWLVYLPLQYVKDIPFHFQNLSWILVSIHQPTESSVANFDEFLLGNRMYLDTEEEAGHGDELIHLAVESFRPIRLSLLVDVSVEVVQRDQDGFAVEVVVINEFIVPANQRRCIRGYKDC